VHSVYWYSVVGPVAQTGFSGVAIVLHQEEEALQAPGSPLSVHGVYLSVVVYLFESFQQVFNTIVVTAE